VEQPTKGLYIINGKKVLVKWRMKSEEFAAAWQMLGGSKLKQQ
jgi:hypothetical protein